MKRAQAFESMNLVVSVIVALAILGVIMYIIYSLPKPIGNDPKSVINQELKSVYTSGYGVSAPREIEFVRGTKLFRQEVVNNLPMKADDVAFICKDQNICNGEPLSLDNNIITANANYKINMVVCGNEQGANIPRYCVSFARTPKDATDYCIAADACDIK
ncbi:MAG: hypothetical protein ABH863_00210 [Candidatus Micrarchaeota archaeon]